MAQKHLYTLNYQQFNPPEEWQGISVDSTVNDDFVKATIQDGTFTFTGDIATYIKEQHIPTYGVHWGLAYRIVVDDQEIIFDGYLVLSKMEIMSQLGPIILKIPVMDLTDNLTSFDRVSVFTQTILKQQGFITQSMYAHLPVVQVSKKGAKDRAIALTNLAYTVLSTFLSIIQDFFSAVADIIGLSAAVGVLEMASLAINIFLQIQQLTDLIAQHVDLLLASQTWYNAIKVKDVVEAAFAKINKVVEWGIIDPVLENLYVKASEYGNPGMIFPSYSNPGILNPTDTGYIISETLQEVQKLFNTREHEEGNTVHIKTKSDPYWTNSPLYTPSNILVETTKQYQNGFYKNNTDEVFATERVVYPYDPTDAWTLTEKNDDAFEVHRELINEPDSRFNTLKGLKDTKPAWVLAVRYDPIDTLTDLLDSIMDEFNVNLDFVKGYINQFAATISNLTNSSSDLAQTLSVNPLNFIFALTPGGLKVEDDTWGIPKLIYANIDDTNILNIPANHKDFIGAEAIYTKYYTYDSPAVEYGFQGQRVLINQLNIPFSLQDFQQTKTNPYFLLDGSDAKFTHINWVEDDRKATADIEKKEVFDTNIKETVIIL